MSHIPAGENHEEKTALILLTILLTACRNTADLSENKTYQTEEAISGEFDSYQENITDNKLELYPLNEELFRKKYDEIQYQRNAAKEAVFEGITAKRKSNGRRNGSKIPKYR